MEPLKKLKSKIRSRPNNIDALVASNLKKRRVELNITQKELATAVGVTTQQIQKYEKAVDRVSSGNLFYFAQILKVPVSYFFGLNEAPEPEFWLNGEKISIIQGGGIEIKISGIQLY